MPQLTFVMSPGQSWYLREFADTLGYELGQQSVPSTMHVGGFPPPGPETVYVLVAPHEYLALEGDRALPDEAILGRTILLCTQPPHELKLGDHAELFRRAGAVFDIDHRSVALLRRAGIPARHLRPGYSKCHDVFDPAAERPIDVMFLGVHSLRRSKQLSRCARVLARHNCLLQVADASEPNSAGSTSFLAESKWDLLARTKVVLNVHRAEDSQLEWLRVLDAIHSGAVVVTEHSSGIAPLIAGEHVIVAGSESLPYVLDAALRDPERLHQIRNAAHERIRMVLPFALSVAVFRAAAVELVGRWVPPNASLGRRAAAEQVGPVTPASEENEAARTVEGRLNELRVEVAKIRQHIARLERIARSAAGGPDVQLVTQTPAWSAHRVPRVTVLTALSNDEKTVSTTLESLARSSFREFEVVIVDDASNDDSCGAASDWMRTHPYIPSLMFKHSVTRGLAAARNSALAVAQAPYCLVLDGGDELYPRGLDVLVGTLDAIDDAVFAYPMLDVIGMTEAFVAAGGDYLVSVSGWEPDRLAPGVRVGSVALFRTDRLREIADLEHGVQLSGWEDYDLWSRLADRGWRGQLVPQILGRYRASWPRVTTLRDVPSLTTSVK